MASELRVDRIIPVNGVPTGGGGGIIQVVQGSYSTQTSFTTGSYADTGLTASITPTSSASKILIIVHHASCSKDTTSSSGRFDTILLRGSTEITKFGDNDAYTATTVDNHIGTVSTTYLDSPATTSTVTYKTQIKNEAGTVYFCINNAKSTLTLMEVSG